MNVEKLIEAGQAFNVSGLGEKKIDFKKWTTESIEAYPKKFALEFMECFETIPEDADIPKSFGEPYMELFDQFESKTGLFEEKEEDDPPKKENKKKGKVTKMKKAETKKAEKKAVAKKEATKEKVKKEAPKREVEVTKDGTKMWAKESSAQIIMDGIISAGKKGAAAEDLEGLKFESSNKKGRVSIVTKEAVKRGLVTKKEEKFFFAK